MGIGKAADFVTRATDSPEAYQFRKSAKPSRTLGAPKNAAEALPNASPTSLLLALSIPNNSSNNFCVFLRSAPTSKDSSFLLSFTSTSGVSVGTSSTFSIISFSSSFLTTLPSSSFTYPLSFKNLS